MTRKTTLKNYILFIICLIGMTSRVDAQQIAEPEACKIPPQGFEKGGDFIFNSSVLCLVQPFSVNINAVLPSGVDEDSEEYLFNFRNGDSLVFSKQNKFTVNQEGTYWVVQKGIVTINNTSKIVITCKAVEVIEPKMPDFEYETCGPNTVNVLIKNTLLNQKQDGYRIKWDDDILMYYPKEKLPLKISYTYPKNFYSSPSLQAGYNLSGSAVCFGTPVSFNVLNPFRITQLQSTDNGREVNLKIESAMPDKEYYVQYTLNNSTEWIETGIKATKNPNKTGEALITGLRSNSKYCFRLAEKDTCNYTIFSTEQMCTGKYVEPQLPFITQLEGLNEGKEAKVSMIEGNMGESYTIQYRLKNIANWTDSPVKIEKNADVGEGIITGLEGNRSYCFRLMHRDSVTKEELVSNEACSISLKSTLLSANAVRLDWDRINNAELRRIAITLMEENGMNMNNMFPGNLSDTTFIFDQLDCSVKYKFNIELTFRSNNNFTKRTVIKSSQILVEPKSVKLIPSLSSFGIVSTNGDNKINYNIFTRSYVPKFEIYRSINGGEMTKVSENSGNAFTDNNVAVGENIYCYAHKYVSGCGNESELSARNCNMLLSSKTYGKLTWTSFTIQADKDLYKKGDTEYTVQLIDASGAVMNTVSNTRDTTISVNIESLSPYLSNGKFRVLAKINGELNFNSQVIAFPIFAYSNQTSLYLILSSESPKTQMNIFPNPTEDRILINSSGIPVRFIELIDMKGQLIYKTEISGDTVNLSEFEKGKYILRLYDANKKLLNTRNIVKW